MAGYVGGNGSEDIARLRRMIAEPTSDTYSDAILLDAIERYPVPDADGYWPDDDLWTESYDHALAASEIWAEKSAAVAHAFDFDADGGAFSKSQQVTHYERQARRWRSLRQPGNYTVETPTPSSSGVPVWLANVNDPYE
jgi:hypothetical protein